MIQLYFLKAGREDTTPTSDIVPARMADPGGAKKDTQDSAVPAATGKRHAGATSADVSKSVKQNTRDTAESTAAEKKKQRYSGDCFWMLKNWFFMPVFLLFVFVCSVQNWEVIRHPPKKRERK